MCDLLGLNLRRLWCLVVGHKLAVVLLVGVVVRLVLMPIAAHPLDMYVWYDASLNIVKNGPFSVNFFPPIQGYILLVPLAYFYNWLSNSLVLGFLGPIPMGSVSPVLDFYPFMKMEFIPGLLFNFVVKLPLVFSDVFGTLLLFELVKQLTKNKQLAERAAMLWFLNPFVIWVSAGWGMWDSLPAVFSLASLFFLLRKKIVCSSLCLSAGVVLKLYPAFFVLPITFYLLKSNTLTNRRCCLVKFYLVFILVLLFLFGVFFRSIVTFFSLWFVPAQNVVADTLINQTVSPVGFGLTYWSLFLLNRLFGLPLSADFVFILSVFSFLCMLSCLFWVYLKISKFEFHNAVFDLSSASLLCLFAVFLTYKVICEQFFVWAIPFLVMFCALGKLKSVFLWVTSLIALLYSILNCPLPFFLLPIAPWVEDVLLRMVYFLWSVESVRILALAVLGCLFSLVLVLLLRSMRLSWLSKG